MKTVLIALLVVWLVVALLGAVVEGLLWLLVVGVVLFAGTALWGWMRLGRGGSRSVDRV